MEREKNCFHIVTAVIFMLYSVMNINTSVWSSWHDYIDPFEAWLIGYKVSTLLILAICATFSTIASLAASCYIILRKRGPLLVSFSACLLAKLIEMIILCNKFSGYVSNGAPFMDYYLFPIVPYFMTAISMSCVIIAIICSMNKNKFYRLHKLIFIVHIICCAVGSAWIAITLLYYSVQQQNLL